ncbi:microfibril-associated glycoprotein 4-like [Littorina saxatilis]|uniref:Fibrinogen C-terminal domain-containing protein n=1 Tax=Littorina saxatilis TaxID=31220 RepID=A0AAN9ANZ5_9CAEN
MMSLVILLAANWNIGGATGTQRSQMYTNAGHNDKAFTEDNVFESPAKTALHCALMCNQQDSCMAFTFDDKVCRGHATVMTSHSPSGPAPGARSFFQNNGQKNCREETKSGVATVYPDNSTPLQVYCDQATDGGGWTVFQRRQDGSVDFYRDWASYQKGFGDPSGEFWLGLDALNTLTSRQTYELRVDLMKWEGTKGYATYSNFSISDSSDNYRLNYDNFTGGNAGDSLYGRHLGQQFSTKDRDHTTFNCAQRFHGAWWYKDCHHSNLNAEYKNSSRAPNMDGLHWYAFARNYDSMKFAEMKLRPT